MGEETEDELSFWTWFIRGHVDTPGYLLIANRWLIADVYIGLVLSCFLHSNPAEFSTAVLVPLAGALAAIVFVFFGNVHGILTSDEVSRLASTEFSSMQDFVFPYYIAVISVISTLGTWAILPYVGLIDSQISVGALTFFPVLAAGFVLISLTIRVCWKALEGTSSFIISVHEIKKSDRTRRMRADSERKKRSARQAEKEGVPHRHRRLRY